ncbi:MAG: transcriptional regulator, IclR family [Acidobacteria bacterium]|jgi:DNA-binding IclR family transcriptional regulator|nr:transcriptional regulator, IclR family [Acidobacteriota bacterium]
MKEPNRRRGILVLHKALDILETIRESRSGLGLAELARALDLPKPTAYRIVATMERRGYLARDRAGHYQMTRRFFDLQQEESDVQALLRASRPVMERLVESCRETVNLGIIDAGEVVVISTIESPQSVRMTSKVGNRRHLHATALGKVLLSGLSANEVRRLVRIQGLTRLTPHTIVSQQALMAELDAVRRQGYALDNEENELDGRCLGAPVSGPGGRIVAALSISAPVFRLDRARARSLAGDLIEASGAISRTLTERVLVGSAAIPGGDDVTEETRSTRRRRLRSPIMIAPMDQ